jgi:hypothetical protein
MVYVGRAGDMIAGFSDAAATSGTGGSLFSCAARYGAC